MADTTGVLLAMAKQGNDDKSIRVDELEKEIESVLEIQKGVLEIQKSYKQDIRKAGRMLERVAALLLKK